MKLRNKKTGKVGWLELYYDDDDNKMIAVLDEKSNYHPYETLAELSKYWEDYQPAELLIKDEKIRKAVRAWAEAIGKEDDLVVSKNMEYHDCCIYDGDLGNTATIDFGSDLDIEENSYTLAELCGEGEEC